MSIVSVEVICLPCRKCENLERQIRQAVSTIGLKYKTVIQFEFKHTKTLDSIFRYSLNAAQTPVVLVNNIVECAGRVDPMLLSKRLESIHKSC